MKVTKEELKLIIKEELELAQEEMLNENPAALIAKLAPLVVKYGPMLMKAIDVVKDNTEIIKKIIGAAASE